MTSLHTRIPRTHPEPPAAPAPEPTAIQRETTGRAEKYLSEVWAELHGARMTDPAAPAPEVSINVAADGTVLEMRATIPLREPGTELHWSAADLGDPNERFWWLRRSGRRNRVAPPRLSALKLRRNVQAWLRDPRVH